MPDILQPLLPSIHDVDRDATRIWFQFYPSALAQAIYEAVDAPSLERRLFLEGRYRLADQIDTSHWFLYGHRYWPPVKAAIIADTTSPADARDFTVQVREIAGKAAASAQGADVSLLTGITAVGVMTLNQVGLDAFRASGSGAVSVAGPALKRTPAELIAARKRDDRQGLLTSFLRPLEARYSVIFDERRRDGRFEITRNQHITTASAKDGRDYSSEPRHCQEGPVPIRCRSGSCGSCWVGVLGGADKMTPIDRVEAHRLKACGYEAAEDGAPVIRLACMAQVSGNVTIVIPPWNGVLGKTETPSPDFASGAMKA